MKREVFKTERRDRESDRDKREGERREERRSEERRGNNMHAKRENMLGPRILIVV